MRPLARQARLQIAQLRDLDLQLAFEAARALRKYIENQLAAIDDADVEFLFQVARLRWAECVIEDGERRAGAARDLAHFGAFASADKGARVGGLEFLADAFGDFGAGAFGERLQLRHRLVGGDLLGAAEFDSHQHGAFGLLNGLAVRISHEMPPPLVLASASESIT